MRILTILILTISMLACAPRTGRVWLKKDIGPAGEGPVDTVKMRFHRYGNAFAVRRPYVIYELKDGHTRTASDGWRAVMFVQDPWPERIKFRGSAFFKEITVYEDRYSTVYVVEYRTEDATEYGTRMTIHAITEHGCTIYIAK